MLSPIRLDIDPTPGLEALPFDLDLVKIHCAIDGDEFDDLLELYLISAMGWLEDATHRTVFLRSHRWVLRRFPDSSCQAIMLPRGRTAAVSGIAYVAAGQSFSLTGPSSGSPAGADYQETAGGDSGAILMPPQGASWPSVDGDAVAPVTITFSAGWEPANIPKQLRHALLFAVSDAFEMRGTTDIGSSGSNLGVREALVSGWRLSRWY